MDQAFPILIVEDDSISRMLLEMTLKRAGYDVVSARDGREALGLFKGRFFPIVFTDWMMREIDGLQLCRTIRETVTEGYVYIFLITAKDSKADMIAGLEAGADDYLTKPFHNGELLARLKTAVRVLNLERSLKEANEAIRILSITDSLTGCYNRTFMNQHLSNELQRALRYGKAISVVMADIDRFKRINDEYGHQAGDHVLKAFVETMGRCIRSGVDWIARYGGEEFLVVLPETNVENAEILADRLREAVSEQVILYRANMVRITASFGVAGVPKGVDPKEALRDLTPDALIRIADRCLYRAKEDGRNRVRATSVTQAS